MSKPLRAGSTRFHVFSGTCSKFVSDRRYWTISRTSLPDVELHSFVAECAVLLGEPHDRAWGLYILEQVKSGRLHVRRAAGKVDVHLDVFNEDKAFAYRMRWGHKIVGAKA